MVEPGGSEDCPPDGFKYSYALRQMLGRVCERKTRIVFQSCYEAGTVDLSARAKPAPSWRTGDVLQPVC